MTAAAGDHPGAIRVPPPPVRTRMADGRELRYFDDAPGRRRRPSDLRRLPPHQPLSEVRYDRVQDEWVVVASHRQTRTHLPSTDDCPLCPSAPGRPTEIPAGDYDVVVFENRFPALDGGRSAATGGGSLGQRGLTPVAPARGRCEVVCFTAEHTASFAGLPVDRLRTVAGAWIDRGAELSGLDGVQYVLAFENRGREIGVTLEHPHGQIYAYPFLPPRAARALSSARAWRDERGGCLFCAVAADEVAAADRVVVRTDRVVAFVPAAARWPLEVHVYPLRHVPDLAALDVEERDELLAVAADVLGRFDLLFDAPTPYVAAWQQAPVHTGRDLAHLRLEAFSPRRAAGKLKYLAGSETAAGVFVNDIQPERAAQMLRAVSG